MQAAYTRKVLYIYNLRLKLYPICRKTFSEFSRIFPPEANYQFPHLKTFDLFLQITYDAAGILSHLCSDGTEAWTISEPTRESVLHRLRSEIEKWNVPKKTKNDITFMSYMTFRPLYRLLKAEHTPECQLWAAWALADLTLVNRKYLKINKISKTILY